MMDTKPTKTRAELESMVMEELRAYDECANVTGVNIVAEGPSWKIVSTARSDEKATCGTRWNEVEEKLRAMYDLAES